MPFFMKLYACGSFGGYKSELEGSDGHYHQSRPLGFDFKNYKIHWDPRVEKIAKQRMQMVEPKKRVIGIDDEADIYETETELDYDEYGMEKTTSIQLKATAPILNQFKY